VGLGFLFLRVKYLPFSNEGSINAVPVGYSSENEFRIHFGAGVHDEYPNGQEKAFESMKQVFVYCYDLGSKEDVPAPC